MPGDVAAVATLLNTIITWFFNPDGYAKLSREEKLETLTDALKVALDNRDLVAADLVFAELRKLSGDTR